jgi:CheY-like chemotaxis protein
MEHKKNKFFLNSVMMNIYFAFAPKIENENTVLSFNFDLHDDESVVIGDDRNFKKILMQLLDNSIKFTNSGSISFGYRVVGDEIEFYVDDTGVGIAPEFINIMYKQFRQEDCSISRRFEGAGLGLSIVDGLIRLLGGTINIESEKNIGTNVRFKIPLERVIKFPEAQNTAVARNNSSSWGSGKRLLIVDDNEDNFTLIKYITRNEYNFEYIWAESGYKALEILESNSDFACILLDIKMPKMDGFETMVHLKKDYPHIPVVAVTAFASPADRDKAYNAGFNDYLSKPIDAGELLMLLRAFK